MAASVPEPYHVLLLDHNRTLAYMDELLTVAQVVEESGFSEDTIRRHIRKGALPVVRRGPFRRIRIRRAEFDRYLKA